MPGTRAISSIVARLALVAAAALAVASVADAAVVRSIRSSAGSNYTRVVIDLTQTTTFSYDILPANAAARVPARLYVDLKNVKLDPRKDQGVWVGDTRVRRVRTGQFKADVARIVLELEGPVSPKVFLLEEPPRLVIDLTGKGATAPPGTVMASKPKPKPAPKPAVVAATPKPKPKPKPVVVAAAPKPKPKPAPKPKPRVAPPAVRHSSPPVRDARGVKVRRVKIVLDPGHGGKDPGARNVKGVTEKHLTFDITRRLADKLRQRLGVEIYMSRASDKYLGLEERKDLANRMDADIFVSIHANASKNTKLRGIETYYLKNTNDRATLRLARLENGVDMLIKGSDVSTDADLSYILSDMVQGQKEADSILLANHLQNDLVGYLRPKYRTVDSLGVKQGPFMVLDGTFMPSVLCEVGFITNSEEGKLLATAAYRESIAEGLYRGIKHYLEDERVDDLR